MFVDSVQLAPPPKLPAESVVKPTAAGRRRLADPIVGDGRRAGRRLSDADRARLARRRRDAAALEHIGLARRSRRRHAGSPTASAPPSDDSATDVPKLSFERAVRRPQRRVGSRWRWPSRHSAPGTRMRRRRALRRRRLPGRAREQRLTVAGQRDPVAELAVAGGVGQRGGGRRVAAGSEAAVDQLRRASERGLEQVHGALARGRSPARRRRRRRRRRPPRSRTGCCQLALSSVCETCAQGE